MPVHSLNTAQLDVLRWVAAGSPAGVMAGYSHRVSAAALRSRGLLRISGRGPRWHAELTDEGRSALARLEAAPSERPVHGGGARAELRSKTERLVADVIEAGGTLRVPGKVGSGGVDWRQRAYAAQRHGKVPEGKHLQVTRTDGGFEISLQDGATGNELGADAIHVPARVARYHPAVPSWRERTSLHLVSRKALPRAM